MPKQTAKSGFAAKVGKAGAEAVEAHKDDEVKLSGGGNLPAGLNGIAKVKMCKFSTYEKGDLVGEYFYMGSAIVVEPEEHKGMRTTIGPEPICSTPKKSRKSIDEHIAFVLNEFKKMGIDTSELTVDQFEETAKALEEGGVYIRFRTYAFPKQEITKKNGKFFVGDKMYPTEAAAKAANPYVGTEPRVNHEWLGTTEYSEEGADDGVDDESDNKDKSKDEEEREETPDESEEESEEVEDSDEAEEDTEDAEKLTDEVGVLAEKADDKDRSAQKQLTKMAKDAGVSEEDLEGADDWQAVAQLIRDASGESEEEEAEEEEEADEGEEWKPEKGDVYDYKVIDPKDPKKRKKTEVEILSVSEKNETVTLKNLDSSKPIIGKDKKPLAVKWADLIRNE